jgi:VWFA-related protein
MHWKAVGLCACLGLIAVGPSAGQSSKLEPQQVPPNNPQADERTVLRVSYRLVVVDVVVLDEAGHPVSNLDRSQFEITENGVPQQIKAFDPPLAYSMTASSAPIVHGTADLGKIGDAPVDILVLDELNNSFSDAANGRLQMLSFLQKQPEVLPVPTQLLAAGESRFQMLHDYTQSRDELLKSVEKHFASHPVQQLDSVGLLVETLGILSQIAESSEGTRGRKNILWVGSGYPMVNTMLLPISSEAILQDAIRRVTDRMLDARVALTLIDPKGIQEVDQGGENFATMDDMSAGIAPVTGPFTGSLDFGTFAIATGGQILANRNDVAAEIGHSADNSQIYYTLAYSPTTGTPGNDNPAAYRKIRIHLKDRSLRAVARDGYFPEEDAIDPPPTASQPLPAVLKFDLLSAAKTRLHYNGITVRAEKTASGYTLSIARSQLKWVEQSAGSRIAEMTLIIAFYNDRDKLLQSRAIELKQTMNPPPGARISPEVKLALPLAPPPTTERVRFVVRDAGSGVMGTADWEQ